MLDYAPAGTNLYATVNVKQIAGSDIFKEIVDQPKSRQLLAVLDVAKNMTGTDVRKDIERACLIGKAGQDESMFVMIQGKLNEEALVSLLRANKEYATTEVAGQKVHKWRDDREKRTKFGVFLAPDIAALFNSAEALEASLLAKKSGKGIDAADKAKLAPEAAGESALWGAVIKPVSGPGSEKDTLKLKVATLSVKLPGNSVEVSLTAHTGSAEAARDWLAIAEGARAVARLQSGNAGLNKLSEGAKATIDESAGSVTLTVSATVDELKKMGKK
jgi:hypothetical protein